MKWVNVNWYCCICCSNLYWFGVVIIVVWVGVVVLMFVVKLFNVKFVLWLIVDIIGVL